MFQREASSVALKPFGRWCGIRNLLKRSSFAAREERNLLCPRGERVGLGTLVPLVRLAITGEEPQAGH